MALDSGLHDDFSLDRGSAADGTVPLGWRRIVVADRHPLFAGAIAGLLSSPGRAQEILSVATFQELCATDLDAFLIFNLALPDMRGVVGLETLLKGRKPGRIVVVIEDEDTALRLFCLDRGLAGVIAKTDDAETIGRVLRAALEGPSRQPSVAAPPSSDALDTLSLYRRLATLSPKQAEVLSFLREGLLNKQIAYELGLTEATVKHHISLILKKLGCYRRTQAVAIANRLAI